MSRYTKCDIYIQWNSIQLSKGSGDSDMCYEMDKFRGHYAKGNKPLYKGQIF